LAASHVLRLAIWAPRSTALPASFQASMATTVPDTGSVTVSVIELSVSVARSSSRGDSAVNRAGKATDQWLKPIAVTAPLVMGVCGMAVPTTWRSRVRGNWSKIRLAGTQASRYRPAPRSVKPKLNASRGPGLQVMAGW
jgi:hypothetical protein